MDCPYCHDSDEIYVSENRFSERLLHLLGLSTYFCRSCYHRFRQFRSLALNKVENTISRWLQREVVILRYVQSRN